MYMTQSIVRTARFALLLVMGFVLGVAAIAIATATNGKNNLMQTLGVSSAHSDGALAIASCDVPSKDDGSDVYFVSCGGFF